MKRSKRLIILAHCVLNQNSVVCPLARSGGVLKDVKRIMDNDVGIIQLPCPEFKYLGLSRKPMTKEEYDTLEYRQLCKQLIQPYIEDIEEYKKHNYELVGLIGINESPTCSISGERGVLMEEFIEELNKRGVEIGFYEVLATEEADIIISP